MENYPTQKQIIEYRLRQLLCEMKAAQLERYLKTAHQTHPAGWDWLKKKMNYEPPRL